MTLPPCRITGRAPGARLGRAPGAQDRNPANALRVLVGDGRAGDLIQRGVCLDGVAGQLRGVRVDPTRVWPRDRVRKRRPRCAWCPHLRTSLGTASDAVADAEASGVGAPSPSWSRTISTGRSERDATAPATLPATSPSPARPREPRTMRLAW